MGKEARWQKFSPAFRFSSGNEIRAVAQRDSSIPRKIAGWRELPEPDNLASPLAKRQMQHGRKVEIIEKRRGGLLKA
jgi:hypothetical protein